MLERNKKLALCLKEIKNERKSFRCNMFYQEIVLNIFFLFSYVFLVGSLEERIIKFVLLIRKLINL